MHPHDPPWNVRSDQPIATWDVELPSALDRAALLHWQQAVLRAGEETLAYQVIEDPRTGYQRTGRGPFTAYLKVHGASQPASPGELDTGLVFDELLTATSRIAHPSPDGTIVEDDIWTMRQIAPRAPSSQRPLSIAAGRSEPGGPIGLDVWIASKIWLPWIYRYPAGDNTTDPEWAAHNPPIDNRPLAERHTPRLNKFLRAIAAVTLDVGGTWKLGHDTLGDYLFELDPSGVLLDAPRPARTTPNASPDLDDAPVTNQAEQYLHGQHTPPAVRPQGHRLRNPTDPPEHRHTR